jgi:sugar lactone lactonase YvrE
MRTFRRLVGILALTTALTTLPGAATQAGGGGGGPDRINLPDGWQPEGITTDGKKLYVGSLVDGAIWKADPRTGEGRVLAPGAEGRTAVGVDYDRRRDLLWVAGGDTGVIRAHDADTGRVLREYALPAAAARFVNDLVVTPRAVYATDSLNAELGVVPLKRGKHLPPTDAVRVLALSGDFVLEDGFNLNGIVRSGHHLVAVQSNVGKLLRINPRSGRTVQIDLGGETVVNGDGIEPGKGVLYVVRNRDNLIAVVDLSRNRTRGAVVDTITDDGFDVPTTAALVRHALYAVNARFGTTENTYWVTRVDARRAR